MLNKLIKLLKFVLYAYILIPNGVDVTDVIVPCTELSRQSMTYFYHLDVYYVKYT